jgi:hypothetical protein
VALIKKLKVKNLPPFALLVDILDIQQSHIPYILFKLEEIKKDEVSSIGQHASMLFAIGFTLTLFHLIVNYTLVS